MTRKQITSCQTGSRKAVKQNRVCRTLCVEETALVEFHAEPRAELRADGCGEKWQRCRNKWQKWIAETVQNLALIGWAEKNGTDAEPFAEAMQKGR